MALNRSQDEYSDKQFITDRDQYAFDSEPLVNKTHINNVFDTSTVNID